MVHSTTALAIMLVNVFNNNTNNSAAENQDTPLYGIGIDCDNKQVLT